MKINRFYYILIAISLLSCKNRNCASLPYGEDINIDRFTEQKKEDENLLAKDSLYTGVIFSNNPFCLDENTYVKFYADSKILYSGQFRGGFSCKKVPVKSVMFRLVIIKDNKAYCFMNKNIVDVLDSHNYIHIVFCPTNTSDEEIKFFPQEDPI